MDRISAVLLCIFLGCDSAMPVGSTNADNSSERLGTVELTESAASVVREFMSSHPTANAIEVSVDLDDSNSGPGYQYGLALTTDPSPGEFVLSQSQGIDIAIDVKSAEFLQGTEIDWIPLSEGEEGFYFHNPNSEALMPDYVKKYYESKDGK